MLPTARQLFYSFPVRLLVLHGRNHLLLLILWGLLTLFSTGLAGRFFGMHYIMLTPEYLGRVDFWSFFITGAAFGAFVMIWNLTTYLLCSNRFSFLATLDAPFTKFCINNSLIPLAFLAVYLGATIWFQFHDELTSRWDIARNIAGFLCGALSLVIFLAGYLYLTNKDIASFLRPGKFIPRPGGRILAPGLRTPTLWEIKSGLTRWRVDTYLTERLHVRLVRSVAHYDPAMLERVFRQNHLNAVMLQVIGLLLLVIQGLFMDHEWVRIPAAASTLFLFSMVMSLFGAITFWFRQWGMLVFLVLMVLVNMLTGQGYFHYRNRAYGLEYTKSKRIKYNYDALQHLVRPAHIEADEAATRQILDNWLARRQVNAPGKKPKMVLIGVSGGGLRSALWTMRVMQKADSATGGRFLRNAVLISGASGGMLGASFIRETYLRQLEGERVSVHDSTLIWDMGKDLLNPVCFALVANDLMYPLSTFKSGNFEYPKDRGYLLERQFNENCRGFFDRRLADYREPERKAMIPMMIVSPYIVNDARRLLISPHGVSYLMQPPDDGRYAIHPEVDGVDFGRLLAPLQADSLMFTTALRMNCTYPLILPPVWLPTSPGVETIDAGFRDNYGITLPVRFIHVFRDWIQENTSGVVIVQIRCWEKFDPISAVDTKGIIDNAFTPVEAASNITTMQDYEQDNVLALLDDLLGKNRLEVIRFIYRPVRKQREASMNLHLSKREKIDLIESFALPDNQISLRRLKRALTQ
jgi:hypothetical protein